MFDSFVIEAVQKIEYYRFFLAKNLEIPEISKILKNLS